MLSSRLYVLQASRLAQRRAFGSTSAVTSAADVPKVKNFINGEFVDSKTDKWIDLHNPATGELIGLVPESTQEEMKEATDAAAEAFKTWGTTAVQQRMRVMLKLQQLIRENTDELAASITKEQGKTLPDAAGDVFRGLEVVEHTTTIPSIMMGETAGNVGRCTWLWPPSVNPILFRVQNSLDRHCRGCGMIQPCAHRNTDVDPPPVRFRSIPFYFTLFHSISLYFTLLHSIELLTYEHPRARVVLTSQHSRRYRHV